MIEEINNHLLVNVSGKGFISYKLEPEDFKKMLGLIDKFLNEELDYDTLGHLAEAFKKLVDYGTRQTEV